VRFDEPDTQAGNDLWADVLEFARDSVADSSKTTYRSGLRVVQRFKDWYGRNIGGTAEFKEPVLATFVVWCWHNHRKAHGTIGGYISAWRYSTVVAGQSVRRDNWPLLIAVLKGYKRRHGVATVQKEPASVVNGKLRMVAAYFGRHPGWTMRARYTALLFMHKLILRPEEVFLTSTSAWSRVPKWKNIEWFWSEDGQTVDMIYTKPFSKTNQHGEKRQSIPCACECPGVCLPHTMLQWYTDIRRRFGSTYVRNNAHIFWAGPDRIIAINEMYDLWDDIRTHCEWDKESHKMYSLRCGRCEDLYCAGVAPEMIQRMGCWESLSFMRYLKTTAKDLLFMLKRKRRAYTLEDIARAAGIRWYSVGDIRKWNRL